ncbi:hypothetical protein BH10PSE6_BH10PSE6_20850 [soil metagenome]
MQRWLVGLFWVFIPLAAHGQCTVPNTLTNGTTADATQVMANFNALLSCINTAASNASQVTAQGRLTLVTGTPVMSSAQLAKATIFYTPYVGNQIAVYNGTSFISNAFSELSNVTTNSAVGSAGPAAVVANSNYDLFVWLNGSTETLTRGPAWSSDISRGTGAGTSELQRLNGIWTNKIAITNGPAANRGTYVGTVRSDGALKINFTLGGVAAGGTASILGVWNAYNRVLVRGFVGDNTASWNYTTATWRAANNSNAMRVSFVSGLQEDFFQAEYIVSTFNGAGVAQAQAGIGFDVTNAPSGRFPGSASANLSGLSMPLNPKADYATQALGFHFMQALEWSQASGTSTWYGDNGGANMQSGMTFQGTY